MEGEARWSQMEEEGPMATSLPILPIEVLPRHRRPKPGIARTASWRSLVLVVGG
jgi:hypothetical protein